MKMTIKQAKSKIGKIENQIKRLEHQKKVLGSLNNKIWCPECEKFYSEGKCFLGIKFDSPGWYDYAEYKCPKGHEWIVD